MTYLPRKERTSLSRVELYARILLRVLETSPPCSVDDLVRLAVQLGMRRPAAEAGLDVLVAAGMVHDRDDVVYAVPRRTTR